ncbi:olfactory receptor 10S1-like [Dermochelys coriacea]|uniref:olfactory receptor 10S1-like n=1 Tax=Dermochelys coriacea TaxID=27794 RepID=UPI0018E8C4B8|nr:olfactory receptor 10S1-like [Dermochelys coriacea]
MEPGNQTLVTDLVLEGLPNTRELPSLFFLLLYLLTLLGNTLTLLTVLCDSQLHALPMYCFLGHLSFLDACLSSVTMPKILPGLGGPGGRTISFSGCVVQLYIFHFLASTECFLYTVMAYDCFLADCHPLHYTVVMSRRASVGLAPGTWLTGSLHATIQAALTFCLPYCGPNWVEYLVCDIPAMLKLACADTATNCAVILANIGAVAAGCFLLICISYACIVSTILKIHTAQGRLRAFSICSTQLSLVLLVYVPMPFVYVHPALSHASEGAVAMFYTMFTPF